MSGFKPVRVQHLAEVVNGYPFDSEGFDTSNGYPLLRIRDVGADATEIRYTGEFVEAARVVRGDVVVGMDGDFKVGQWLGAEDALLNQRVALLRTDAITARFLLYALPQELEAINAVSYATTVKHLSASQILHATVSWPGIEGAAVIVDFLDRETAKIDALIAKQERLVAALRDRMTAEASSLVWRGLSKHELAPSGIDPAGDSPTHWRRLRNKDVLFERVQLSRAGDEELLTVSHLTGIRRRADSNVNMFEAESTEGYKQVEAGDLVINTLWAWMGALGVSELDGIVSPAYGVYAVRTGAGVEPAYLHHLMRSPAYVTEMTRHSKGVWTSRLRLYPASFLGLNLVVPPRGEQLAIVAYLNERQAKAQILIAKATELIALMQERRAALITAAVTGKLDVTTYGKAG